MVLENTGVHAYSGQALNIKQARLRRRPPLSILTVEARHAGSIGLHQRTAPTGIAPDGPFDTPFTAAQGPQGGQGDRLHRRLSGAAARGADYLRGRCRARAAAASCGRMTGAPRPLPRRARCCGTGASGAALSQLDLALEAGMSARHLSFVETGRSRPSAEMVLHLAEQLDVPLRERNELLLAAGYAPAYRSASSTRRRWRPVRDAIERVLDGHEPYPALVVDRHWELVAANRGVALLTAGVTPRPARAAGQRAAPDAASGGHRAADREPRSSGAAHILERLGAPVIASAATRRCRAARRARGLSGAGADRRAPDRRGDDRGAAAAAPRRRRAALHQHDPRRSAPRSTSRSRSSRSSRSSRRRRDGRGYARPRGRRPADLPLPARELTRRRAAGLSSAACPPPRSLSPPPPSPRRPPAGRGPPRRCAAGRRCPSSWPGRRWSSSTSSS